MPCRIWSICWRQSICQLELLKADIVIWSVCWNCSDILFGPMDFILEDLNTLRHNHLLYVVMCIKYAIFSWVHGLEYPIRCILSDILRSLSLIFYVVTFYYIPRSFNGVAYDLAWFKLTVSTNLKNRYGISCSRGSWSVALVATWTLLLQENLREIQKIIIL